MQSIMEVGARAVWEVVINDETCLLCRHFWPGMAMGASLNPLSRAHSIGHNLGSSELSLALSKRSTCPFCMSSTCPVVFPSQELAHGATEVNGSGVGKQKPGLSG
jgi:hypothetical protein